MITGIQRAVRGNYWYFPLLVKDVVVDFHPMTCELNSIQCGYPGGVLRMQYHSTAAVDFFFAPSEWMNVIG